MPSRWEVRLAGPPDAPIPLAAPQAAVSGWLDDREEGEARPGGDVRSAHNGPARAWACGPMRMVPPGQDDTEGTGLAMEVRLLDDSLAGRLARATAANRRVRLGAHHYRIAAPVRQTGWTSWAELCRWSGERAWQIRFVTPVCLRRGNRTSPWPAPESIARGLADRWRHLSPSTAPEAPARDGNPIWVSDLDGHSQTQILTRRARRNGQWALVNETVSGFTGRIRYVCDRGSDADAAAFHALIGFAVYAGTGSHTTYGFGVVCAEPTWQPPSAQAGSL